MDASLQDVVREHPEAAEAASRFNPRDLDLGVLDVYDDDAEKPTLSIRFLQATIINVSNYRHAGDYYVIRKVHRDELSELPAEIKWSPVATKPQGATCVPYS